MSNIKERVVIVGAGGHGRELASYVRDIMSAGWTGEWVGYLDDVLAASRENKVLGTLGALGTCPDEFFENLGYITAIGHNPTRRTVVRRLHDRYGDRLRPWTLKHPTSYVGADVEVGRGTCLAPGAIVTAGVRLGRHVILNVKASVSHDCVIDDFVNVNPSATICGNVTVGEGAYIGAGATIKEKVSIGAWSIVGAGAVVVSDVPANVTVVGSPARPLRQQAFTL